MYVILVFALGLCPSVSFVGTGDFMLVLGIVLLVLCDSVVIVGTHLILCGIATRRVVVVCRSSSTWSSVTLGLARY